MKYFLVCAYLKLYLQTLLGQNSSLEISEKNTPIKSSSTLPKCDPLWMRKSGHQWIKAVCQEIKQMTLCHLKDKEVSGKLRKPAVKLFHTCWPPALNTDIVPSTQWSQKGQSLCDNREPNHCQLRCTNTPFKCKMVWRTRMPGEACSRADEGSSRLALGPPLEHRAVPLSTSLTFRACSPHYHHLHRGSCMPITGVSCSVNPKPLSAQQSSAQRFP